MQYTNKYKQDNEENKINYLLNVLKLCNFNDMNDFYDKIGFIIKDSWIPIIKKILIKHNNTDILSFNLYENLKKLQIKPLIDLLKVYYSILRIIQKKRF